ncbi:hypothetical protein TYRP_003129 [Tyrophagus putrescentiae]|nr:hypothetical protein TYRP_003129 [Tyrophagus putrescentiae]
MLLKVFTLFLPLFFFFFFFLLVHCAPVPESGRLTVNLGDGLNLTCMLKLAEFDPPCLAQLERCCHYASYTDCVRAKAEADTACKDALRPMVTKIIGAMREKCGTLMDRCPPA